MDNKGFISFLALVLVIITIGLMAFAGFRIYQSQESVKNNEVAQPTTLKGEKFTFSAAGDFSSSENAGQVLTSIGKSGSNFTLGLGDLGYGGNGTEKEWCDFVKTRVGSDYPFEIVAGNHDDGTKDGDIHEYSKCLPNRLEGVIGDYGTEYYFDYNNLARFIMISPDIVNYGFDYSKESSHYDWVANTIMQAREKGLRWVVLGMHKNCITPGAKSCEIGEDILNLAIEKGVDLILQGHEHSYFRSKQLRFSPACEMIVANQLNSECVSSEGDTFNNEGSLISITGTGGYVLRDMNFEDPELGYFDSWNAKNSGNSYGYSSFEVFNDYLKGSFIPAGIGQFTDNYTINYEEN